MAHPTTQELYHKADVFAKFTAWLAGELNPKAGNPMCKVKDFDDLVRDAKMLRAHAKALRARVKAQKGK